MSRRPNPDDHPASDKLLVWGLVALFLVVLVFAAVAFVGGTGETPEPGRLQDAIDRQEPAREEFADSGFGEAALLVADRPCALFLVADDDDERVQGLRDVDDLGPYAGMLFVFDDDVQTGFVMQDTLIPLDIGWYDADGELVDRTTMTPCPPGEPCPAYESSEPYRYALEVPAGRLPDGPLRACRA